MKKIVSFILILALVLSNMIIVRAEDSVIQSKTATPLDENYNTKITLVLNGDMANPSTGDNIMIYVTTFVLSSVSLVRLLLNKKKLLKRS